MTTETTYSPLRWLTGSIVLLAILGESLLWFAPSPILTVILQDLNMNFVQGGLLVSVVCLALGAMGLVSGPLTTRFDAKYIFFMGIVLMAAGQLSMILVRSYSDLLILRLVVGLGMGLCVPIYATLTMSNFPARERPLVNTIFSALPYIATAITFTATVPLLYTLGGSWRLTMFVFGVYVALIAVLWAILGNKTKTEKQQKDKGLGKDRWAILRSVIQNREVKLLCLADICDMWGYNFLSAYLPTYYVTEAGLSLSQSSNLTAIFPIAGIIAGVGCGLWMIKVGLRKPFTWPMHLMICLGTILAVCTSGPWRAIGVAMAGFGNAGWAPALFTMPMEFEGMTPAKVGIAFSFIFSFGYFAAFISPLLGGYLGEIFSLKTALLLYSVVSLVAALATFKMKETGPRYREK